jgi:hypothetical protein
MQSKTAMSSGVTLLMLIAGFTAIAIRPYPPAVARDTSAASTVGRDALIGVYMDPPDDPPYHSWMGFSPDFAVGAIGHAGPANAYIGSGGRAANLGPFGDWPLVVSTAHVDGQQTTDFESAADGSYRAVYREFVNTIAPYAHTIYAVRIDWEWSGNWNVYSPFYKREPNDESHPNVSATTWVAGWRNLAKAIKGDPRTAHIKIEWDFYGTAAEEAYYPGDEVVDLIGFDYYFNREYDGASSSSSWNRAITRTDAGNINKIAAFADAHHKPMIVPEWGDTYTDGYCITQFATWMRNHNVVAQSYWDSNDALKYGSKLQDYPPRQQAYQAAFANTSYTGRYWVKIPIPFRPLPGF